MSSLPEIMADVDLEEKDIIRYFKALQQLCRDINIKKGILGICPRSYVEAAAVRIGDFFILGAYDRKCASTRLEVLTEEEALESMHPIKLLSRWLYTNATLICEQKIPDGIIPGIKTLAAETDVTNPLSPLAHILNIYGYLTVGLARMFEKLNHRKLSKELINGFLSERQWRDKFGRNVELAFWTMMTQIRDLNVSDVPAKKAASVISGYINHGLCVNPKNKEVCELRWGPFTPSNQVGPNPLLLEVPSKPVVVVKDIVPTRTFSKPAIIRPRTSVHKLPPSDLDVASFFLDIPEIPGSNLYLTSKSMLAIKIRLDESDHDANAYNVDSISLGLRLKKEGFISSPVRWLVKKGYIKSSSDCYVCHKTAFLRDNAKFSDGCSWSCQNRACQFENVFKRPKFFARFPLQPMAHISAMIFHWTVQSDAAIITSDAPMDIVKISHAWRAFQLLCCSALKRDRSKIGGEKLIVEVALVQYGKKYVLGAMDRNTNLSFLRAFHGHMFTTELLCKTLRSWINPGTYVIVNAHENLRLPSEFHLQFADTNVTDKKSNTYHVLNITSYLLNHVSLMFGHLRAEIIRPEAMQVFLDELMWRERNGRKPLLAFAKIMHEIFYNELSEKPIDILVDEEFSQQSAPANPLPVIQLKEARIVLRRIPKTVLKYYNCLPIDSSMENCSPREDSNPIENSSPMEFSGSIIPEKEDLTKVYSTEETCASLENIPPSVLSRCGSNLTPTLIKKCRDEDEYVVVDDEEDDSETDTDSNPDSVRDVLDLHFDAEWTTSSPSDSKSVWGRGAPRNSKQGAKRKHSSLTSKSSNDEESPSHSMDSNKALTNSVQKLVINVCRKNKRPKFYIKSDSSSATTSNENSTDGLLCDELMEGSQIKTEPSPLESDEHSSSKLCIAPLLVRKAELEDLEASSSKLKRCVQEKHECVECGESVFLDHFMKNFFCTDCKNLVYTTCCSKAFFEHRSSLLFGKRAPRRHKDHKGLHRSIRLSQPWACKCGFRSVHGNQLASHLVKCQEETCYLSSQ